MPRRMKPQVNLSENKIPECSRTTLCEAINTTKLNESPAFKELCGKLRELNRCMLFSKKTIGTVRDMMIEDGKLEYYINDLITLYAYIAMDITCTATSITGVYRRLYSSYILSDIKDIGMPSHNLVEKGPDPLYELLAGICCHNPLNLK